VGPDFEDLKFFTSLSQGDQSRIRNNQLEESKNEEVAATQRDEGGGKISEIDQDPLFVGERLRM